MEIRKVSPPLKQCSAYTLVLGCVKTYTVATVDLWQLHDSSKLLLEWWRHHVLLQCTHTDPKPSRNNVHYYAIHITASQFLDKLNCTMLLQASRELWLQFWSYITLYLRNICRYNKYTLNPTCTDNNARATKWYIFTILVYLNKWKWPSTSSRVTGNHMVW